MTHDVYGAPDWLSRQAGSESSAGHTTDCSLLTLVSRVSLQHSEVFCFINCAVTTSLCCNTSGTRSNMRLWSPVLLCLAAALSTAFVISPPHMWTKLILTHHWPKTFCSMEHCHANISFWTLHGLWPDKGIDCNSSWHFNSSQIEDLLPDMKKSWPDLLKPFSTEFWKYEWHKHGTCAAKADSLNSQHKYFGKALELYHKLDLDSILRKFDIIPSENYYKLSQIEGVIENFYNVIPKIQCAHPTKNDDFQTLGQIEICFDPDFTLVDCERHTMETVSREDWGNTIAVDRVSGFSVCDHDMPVYYPPSLP